MDVDRSLGRPENRLARAVQDLESIWIADPGIGRKTANDRHKQWDSRLAQNKDPGKDTDFKQELDALAQLLAALVGAQNNALDEQEEESCISKLFLENLAMRCCQGTDTQDSKERHNLQTLCIYYIYRAYPSLRPLARLALIKSLNAVGTPKRVSQAYGIKSILRILIAIFKGMAPGQGNILEPVIKRAFMPLLHCTALISPRTAEPLLSVYKSALMHCLYLAIKNDNAKLGLSTIKALIDNWRTPIPNAEREVILLDILDLILDAVSQNEEPQEAEEYLRVSLRPLFTGCMSLNGRIAEKSLTIVTHSTAVTKTIVAGGDRAAKMFCRALVAAIYARGEMHWNAGINRMRLEAFEKLESQYGEIFNSLCADHHNLEGLSSEKDFYLDTGLDNTLFLTQTYWNKNKCIEQAADLADTEMESEELMGSLIPEMRAPKPGDLKRGRWTPTVAPFGRTQAQGSRPSRPVTFQPKPPLQQRKAENPIPRLPVHTVKDQPRDSSLQGQAKRFSNNDISDATNEQENSFSSDQVLRIDPKGFEGGGVFKFIERMRELVAKEKKEEELLREKLKGMKLEQKISSGQSTKPQLLPLPLPNLAFHDLVFGAELGRGTFATVHYVKQIKKDSPPSLWPEYAVKVLSSEVIDRHNLWVQLAREIAAVRSICHEGISHLLSIFRLRDDIYMVFELGERGDLLLLLNEKGSLSEDVTKFLIAEVATTLRYLHQVGFVYCDLKPENILITKEGHAKLSDFGSVKPSSNIAHQLCADASKTIHDLRDGDWKVKAGISPAVSEWLGSHVLEKVNLESEQENVQFEIDERIQGTAAYLAPEVVAGEDMTPASDAWALGCVIFQCLIGQSPIKEQTLDKVLQKIVNFSIKQVLEEIAVGGEASAALSSSAIEIIAALMERNVTERMQNFDKIFSFSFFSSLNMDDPDSLFKRQPPETKQSQGAFLKRAAETKRQFSTILWAPSHSRQTGSDASSIEKASLRDAEREELMHDDQLGLKAILEGLREKGSPFVSVLMI